MSTYEEYPLIPETAMDGFTYGAITPIGADGQRGAGVLEGPDGSRAGIQWELSDSSFIERVEGPDGNRWGVYRLGFTRPVASLSDLIANLQALLPKLKVLYSRARVH